MQPQYVAADLTAFQQNILVILAEEPRYGLAIKRELEEYYGDEVNHGRLYPNLDDLVERGLVEKSELDKRTNQYELTERGYDVVDAQREWAEQYLEDDEEQIVADGGREMFLAGEAHWCDLCDTPFDSLKELANHSCGGGGAGPQQVEQSEPVGGFEERGWR